MDSYGNEDDNMVEWNVSFATLIANFTFYPQNLTTADIIQFEDLSYDIDGYIVNYIWDFGDGNTSYEQNPQHSYTKVEHIT